MAAAFGSMFLAFVHLLMADLATMALWFGTGMVCIFLAVWIVARSGGADDRGDKST